MTDACPLAPAPAIVFEGVSKCYRTPARGEHWALRHLHLTCRAGAFTCLVGPSGCGKSTLLRLAMGLEKTTEGRIVYDPVQNAHPGFVSQEGGLLPWRRVEDNIALGLEIGGMAKKARLAIAHQALAQVGLPLNIARSYPHELSGGMRQRVALARMACQHARALLMDEPFASVDEVTRHRLQEDLLALWLREKQTLLFVTHSLEEAAYLAERIIIMQEGGVAGELDLPLPRPRDRQVAYAMASTSLRQMLGEAQAKGWSD